MARLRGGWINLLAFLGGCAGFARGVIGLMDGFTLPYTVFTVLSFLIAGWAALDYRRFVRGTPESEVGGGHTIE